MTGYQAKCPACGAELVFQLGTSLARVCEHCGVLVARKGADVANYGKVANLIPTNSVLKLGVEGDYAGAPPFALVGHLQLSWADGTWDEWLMGFRDGSWSWLAESQGKFHYMGQVALPPLPDFDDLAPGRTVDLGPPGTFVVTEVRRASFAAAEGELPFEAKPGSELRFADLSGPGGQFGTIDYGTGNDAESLYVGREIALNELGLRGLPEADERRKAARAEGLKCPQCGGPLEIRAPDQTQRVACPYCGSLLDATRDLKVIEALARPPFDPLIPLGGKGRLSGVEWTLIGAMVRSVTVEGVRYPWTEYLLYEPARGFRWLVEAKRHWSFVEPVNPGDVQESGPTYRGVGYAHFQSGLAAVDHVLGEFYWTVASGDQSMTDDYVKPPHMLSKEQTSDEGQEDGSGELTWSHGTYMTPAEVWAAFSLTSAPPEPMGIAPHQPSPYAEAVHVVWRRALLACAAVFALFVMIWVVGSRQVIEQTVSIPAGVAPTAPESATFLGPFEIGQSGNIQVKVNAPVNNSWLYLEGALINETTGAVDDFDVEVSYYFGSDGDGSWSEGGLTSTRYLSSVPAGKYVLRLQPQWEPGRVPPDYKVTLKSRVPRLFHVLLAWLAILVMPLIVTWKWFRFEVGRWSESDHPWMESSGDSSEDSSEDE